MRGGEIIREARRRAGLSQQLLADRLGTTQSVITRWETDQRSPTFETLVRAVRACGLDLAVSLGPADPDHDLFIRENLQLSPAARLQQITKQRAGLDELLAAKARGSVR
jgi:transcriptional regulator with XRE-family HTH domain